MYLVDNGLSIHQGGFSYAWYLIEENGCRFYRVAALRELYVLTEDPNRRQTEEGILGKQWGAVRGLYNADINFLYSACGIFDPEYMGIVQLYGAAANGQSEEEAAQKALADVASVEATLAGHAQSKMRTPDLEVMRWYVSFLAKASQPLVILGHPDPRVKRQDSTHDGAMPETGDDLASEQNEILFRGLAKRRENFVFQITNEHIARRKLAAGFVQVSRLASNFASRQKGSKSIGFSLGIPIFNALSRSFTGASSVGETQGVSTMDGATHGWGNSHTDSQSHTDSRSHSSGVTESWGETGSSTESAAHTESQSHTDSSSHSVSSGSGSSWGTTHSASMGQNINVGASLILNGGGGYSLTESYGSSVGGSSFSSTTDTSGSSDTKGTADTTGHAESEGWSHSIAHSEVSTVGSADSRGQADGVSESWGDAHSAGQSQSIASAQSGGNAVGGGLTYGLSPSISLNQSWQTEDDLAARLTDIVRGLETLLNTASKEGGFATNAYLFTQTQEGAGAAAALVPQSFHGPNVPTPVMTIMPASEDLQELTERAQAFLPFLKRTGNSGDPFDGLLYWKYATLLPSEKVAAYTAPGMIQEGTLKVIAPIPEGIGFFPQMPGEVVLGHQYSPATAELTSAQIRLEKSRLMHTLFAGNTGFGKSVAAMRMVYEMALRWCMRIVVLDFGFAWRSLLNAPGIEDRVDIRQLRPDGVRPMRWNPMQIGTYVNPETQLKAFADIFGTIAQLGQKQQQHRLLDSARTVYLKAGVLVDDPEVRGDAEWGKVKAEEALLVSAACGTPLGNLTPDQHQKIAVARSKKVGLMDLYQEIETQFDALNPRDQVGRGVLEGILWRLKSLVRGAPSAQFAPSSAGNETIPVEDLGRPLRPGDAGGVVILEGGKFLDNFAKAWLLGWAGWLIYSDMVARRERQLNQGEADLFMVYEEANIIFSGLDGGDTETSSGPSVSEQQSNMFRDSRKYGCYFGVITQSPSLIPAGIRTSCNNVVVGYLTDPKDKDVVLSSLARSEKGFHDEPWRRFISDEHIGMVIGRFPYTTSREQQMPMLFRPLILNVPEPNDTEIEHKLGRIAL